MSEVDQQDGEDQPEPQADERAVHALPPGRASSIEAARAAAWAGTRPRSSATSRGDGAEVAVLHVGVDVVERLHVVVVDDRRRACRAQAIARLLEQLRRPSRLVRRGRACCMRAARSGIDAVLRGLHGDRIVDAVARVDPVVGRRPGCWS